VSTNDSWLSALAEQLRRHGVDRGDAAAVLAETAVHLRDSGQPAPAVFGPPEAYAAAVADSLGPPPVTRRPAGAVRLQAKGITKRYGRRAVLSHVDLTVRAGEVLAIVGANGSGKSTLLRICAGLESPDSGTVAVHGTLGYCPQDGGTADFLAAEEHFVLVGAGRGLDRGTSRRAGRDDAATLDWRPDARTQARHLSGGTRQKLNLVLAGLGEPDVLLLDEPYQGFDRGSYLDFWQRVWGWRADGRAVVVVTHLLSQLDRVDAVVDLTPEVGA
jgi:ABC-type multidrug transport system ATPase subunit